MIRAIRDWLASLTPAELRRSRFGGPLPDAERESRRVNETPDAKLKRISKLPR